MTVYTGTTLTGLSYDELVSWINLSAGGNAQLDAWIAESANYGISEIEAIEDMAAQYMNFYKDGAGNYTITSFNNSAQISNVSSIDSNVATISRSNVQTPLNRGIDSVTGKLNITKFPASGSFSQQAGYVLGSVGSAVAAVSTGITLGKVIDSALYNINPDYWNSIGMESLNPETWNQITNGDDSWQAGLFNFILGLDPSTGDSQLYMEQEAFAYLAYALAQNNWFASGIPSITNMDGLNTGTTEILLNHGTYGDYTVTTSGGGTRTITGYAFPSNNGMLIFSGASIPTSANLNIVQYISYGSYYAIFSSDVPISFSSYYMIVNGHYYGSSSSQYYVSSRYVVDNKTVYYGFSSISATQPLLVTTAFNVDPSETQRKNVSWLSLYGDYTVPSLVDGVSNQSGATIPSVSSWEDIPSTLSSLQSQYPDLWNNALVYDNYQPDGTNPQITYIPVATPVAEYGTDVKPTSGNSTQTDPQVDPDISIEPIIRLLTSVMTQPNPQTNPQTQEETDTNPQIPPQNPVDTGTGNTPTPVNTSGDASALWSVYHPTQAQVNSFGSWLWSGNIITQIQQLLNNPMDGIITLHKVFITPIDSGNSTIVVGRLDSEVPSATVNQQYVYTNCGTVNCYEEFGNVFDYDPYTKVSLYLPFIGIVPLNTSEVMRSQINIKYGVDVFTGACLAMVAIIRDGNTVNMYQYSGMASVEYPLTGAIHNGLINGILGVAGGIAGIAAASTGVGMVAGIGALASGASNIIQSSNAHAGSFSGNSGAMGIKKPYIIIERPQTKVANDFILLDGYPTNYSVTLNNCTGHVVCSTVHVNGINATEFELNQIESILKDGIEL